MKIEVLRKFVFWYYRLKAANGQILTTSEIYASKSNAEKAARKLGAGINVKVVVR